MLDRNGDEHRLTVVGRGHANNERNKQTRHRQERGQGSAQPACPHSCLLLHRRLFPRCFAVNRDGIAVIGSRAHQLD